MQFFKLQEFKFTWESLFNLKNLYLEIKLIFQ